MIFVFNASLPLVRLLKATIQTGVSEQMMAASPLDTYISAHVTNPLPNTSIKKPLTANTFSDEMGGSE